MNRAYDPTDERARGRMVAWTVTLVTACALVAVVSWPSDAASPQRSWYAFAPVRAGLAALWGAFWGVQWGVQWGVRPFRAAGGPSAARHLGWLVAASAATVPLDVVTFAATRPPVPAVWALSSGAAIGVATFGLVDLVARAALRFASPPTWSRRWLVAPLVFAVPFLAPIVVGVPGWLPSSFPSTPGIGQGTLLTVGTAWATWSVVRRRDLGT